VAPLAARCNRENTHAPGLGVDIGDPGVGSSRKRTAGRCSRAASNLRLHPLASAELRTGGVSSFAQIEHAGQLVRLRAFWLRCRRCPLDAALTRPPNRAAADPNQVACFCAHHPGDFLAQEAGLAAEAKRQPATHTSPALG